MFSSYSGRALGVVVTALLAGFPFAVAQLPNSFPHDYPGKPSGDYSPKWQSYFQVTKSLPNVTFSSGRSFAGNIPVQRIGHPNNTLFFLGYEKSYGSLTAAAGQRSTEPWGIWLNGGPGSSSMYGMFFENGPIRINSDYSASANSYSWDKLADYFWLDQPVGVGFSTADSAGYVPNEEQLGADFMGFLDNLVKVFPSLASRPLHLTGESYAGTYIPYILKAYFGMRKPPVKIAKIAIGDGTMTAEQVFELLPALSVIQTYPQLIGYDPEVYKYFKQQSQLCGYSVNLTYPQHAIIPSVPVTFPTQRTIPWKMSSRNMMSSKSFLKELYKRAETVDTSLTKRDREFGAELWKRDLSLRANGTLDPWIRYGCFLLDEFIDYAINYTFPWSLSQDTDTFGFDVYDVTDALNPEVNADASIFLNDARTREALHAPTSKDWELDFDYTFGDLEGSDPSPEPMTFLTELATNASSKGVGIIFFSGNKDALIPHLGTEIAIQNTTFGGVRGFTRRPATPWNNDDGTFAGIVHQERGWTYALFDNAGHLVPQTRPAAAFTFLREFILGSNPTGLVKNSAKGVTVVGGEDAKLAASILPGGDEIFYGSATTQSTYVAPAATRAAWKSFFLTETAIAARST